MSYWVKQSIDNPAFPDMLWSRPERRDQAGKLLIMGGNQHSFAAPAEAYTAATSAGVGVARVLLPNKLQRTVSAVFPAAEYGASTPSGSFAKAALADVLDLAGWADGVLIAGDTGHNSETAVLLESFLQKFSGQITVTHDSAEYFLGSPSTVLHRPSTCFVLTMAQLQKLARSSHISDPITQSMGLVQLAEWLHGFTADHQLFIITKYQDHLIVAVDGQVSTTPTSTNPDPWRVQTAASASVWWLQHPDNAFAALTASVLDTVDH